MKNRIFTVITVALFIFISALNSGAFQAPPSDKVLPNYDCRNDFSFMISLSGEWLPDSADASQLMTLQNLTDNGLRQITIKWNPKTGLPHFIFGINTPLTA